MAKRNRIKTETHRLETAARTATVKVHEEPGRVLIKLRFSEYGDFGDLPEITRWLWPILSAYENDPRPTVKDHPLFPQRARSGHHEPPSWWAGSESPGMTALSAT